MITYDKQIRALADPTRRRILERLRGGGLSVNAIAAGLPVTRPAVSQHLQHLKAAGLVTERRAGARRLYRVEPDALAALRDYLAWLVPAEP